MHMHMHMHIHTHTYIPVARPPFVQCIYPRAGDCGCARRGCRGGRWECR